jgi:hypothetical protein
MEKGEKVALLTIKRQQRHRSATYKEAYAHPGDKRGDKKLHQMQAV